MYFEDFQIHIGYERKKTWEIRVSTLLTMTAVTPTLPARDTVLIPANEVYISAPPPRPGLKWGSALLRAVLPFG